jgi:hypothetical protein
MYSFSTNFLLLKPVHGFGDPIQIPKDLEETIQATDLN